MSADNGIYIAKFPDGFRVIHAQAIENIVYHPLRTKQWKKTMKEYFGKAPLFATKDEAVLYAHKMEEEILADGCCPILEYGVSYLGELEGWG
jgi:hypothetical protein